MIHVGDGLRHRKCANKGEEQDAQDEEKKGGDSQELRWLGPGHNSGRAAHDATSSITVS